MCKVIAASLASVLVLMTYTSQARDTESADNWHQNPDVMSRLSLQSHMFDGISLTEQQRQQMRDLMQRARHDLPPVDLNDIEIMHRLVTAKEFDERAVQAQAEKMAQEQANRQVEMARVRNQMYRLLSPDQRAVLNEKYSERMQSLREHAEMQKASSETLFSRSSNQ